MDQQEIKYMKTFDFPQKCTKCGNLKTFPYSWSITSPPKMCNCLGALSLHQKPERKKWKNFDTKNYPLSDYIFPDPKGPTTITSDIHKILLKKESFYIPDPNTHLPKYMKNDM
jgi:hypothetical protein